MKDLNNKNEILGVAAEALSPAFEMADDVYVIRGTEAHTGPDSELEEAFAKDIKAVPDKDNGNHSWSWLTGRFDGLQVDIAHKTTIGGRAWTEANGINYLASDVLQRYAERDERPPDLAVRAHVHKSFDSYDNKRVRALILPCWKLIDSYGHSLNPVRWSHFGAVVFVIENGVIRKEQKWKTEVSQYPQLHYRRRL